MKTLVLGGCGFIGSHIVDALTVAGHQVRVVDRAPERFRPPVEGVDYRLCDYSSVPDLKKALVGVDVVIHCVSTTVPATSNKNPQADVRENLIGTLGLLNAMLDCGVSKIVYLSSGGTVYGMPEKLPIPEGHALRPICSYGVVKVAVENYLGMYQHLYGLKPVVIRPSNPYGPRQSSNGMQGVIPAFARAMLLGKPISIWGDGSVARDYFHVRDLARLCVLAMESGQTEIFNAGSGEGHDLLSVVQMLSNIIGVSPQIKYKEERAYDVPEVVLDISKAQRLLGWRPVISLEDGFTEYVSWLRVTVGNENG